MPYIFGYTKSREQYYFSGNEENYPGLSALNCDVDDALHLAYSEDGETFVPLRNNTGVLFPQADTESGVIGGITKTLIQPWIFRRKDEGFGVCAVRREQDKPDSNQKGCILLFFSDDLIRYSRDVFVRVGESEIRAPRCWWETEKGVYILEWEEKGRLFHAKTVDFRQIFDKEQIDIPLFHACDDKGIAGAVPGNVVEISLREGEKILKYLGRIRNTGAEEPVSITEKGKIIPFTRLPEVKCFYNDGSVHEKRVDWSKEDYDKIDFLTAGTYYIRGKIKPPKYEFPFVDFNISDPYLYYWKEQYYMIYLNLQTEVEVMARRGCTLEELKDAPEVRILSAADGRSSAQGNWWAPELHVIEGVPYILTTVGTGNWNTTKSCIYRCTGDVLNAEDWEGPYLVVKPDKTPLRPDGVSLDMTYFQVGETHYVMWSDRQWADPDKQLEPEIQDCANTMIAAVDPRRPWELISMPVCIRRPVYGWERYETKVEEGPFLLQRGKDLFVTIACSSTALSDLYCVGILHSTTDNDLLSPDSWDWFTWPVLTKESVPGEYGPGHNCFVKDIETGDDLFVYHAVRHDEKQKALGRYMGIRRVHWGASGYPYLEMTSEEDLDPNCSDVKLRVEVLP